MNAIYWMRKHFIIIKKCVHKQLAQFLDFSSEVENKAIILNNYDWMKDFFFLDFIRDIGKHITVNYMMAKDSVKSRLNWRRSRWNVIY